MLRKVAYNGARPLRSRGSIIDSGGSGRLWVRGQSCKLTGCMTAIDGESFPPEASGPRA